MGNRDDFGRDRRERRGDLDDVPRYRRELIRTQPSDPMIEGFHTDFDYEPAAPGLASQANGLTHPSLGHRPRYRITFQSRAESPPHRNHPTHQMARAFSPQLL